MDIDAYLRRIRYDGPLDPDLETLRALHAAHLETVPFENLDIHLGRPIVLDEETLFDKIVRRRRGGFCYELNGLFGALLRRLGFRVARLSAGVRRDDGGYGPDFDHMTLLVDLKERWLADVGFGEAFRLPLRADDLEEQIQDGRSFRIAHDGPRATMLFEDQAGEIKGYRFDWVPRELSDYEAMSRYHQTSPDSSFTQRRVCSRATPTGRITLRDDRLIITDGRRREERLLAGDEWWRALERHFEISREDLTSPPS
jgi:N-hydroxyarylamine O-acetyltransferase